MVIKSGEWWWYKWTYAIVEFVFQKLPFLLEAEKTILNNASAFAIKDREKGELHPRNTKAATLPEIEKEKEVAPRSTLLSLFTLFSVYTVGIGWWASEQKVEWLTESMDGYPLDSYDD